MDRDLLLEATGTLYSETVSFYRWMKFRCSKCGHPMRLTFGPGQVVGDPAVIARLQSERDKEMAGEIDTAVPKLGDEWAGERIKQVPWRDELTADEHAYLQRKIAEYAEGSAVSIQTEIRERVNALRVQAREPWVILLGKRQAKELERVFVENFELMGRQLTQEEIEGQGGLDGAKWQDVTIVTVDVPDHLEVKMSPYRRRHMKEPWATAEHSLICGSCKAGFRTVDEAANHVCRSTPADKEERAKELG